MRLLVDAHVFDGPYQGTRTYIEGLYSHMTQHKDIDFYFAANKEEQLKSVFGESANVHYIHLNSQGSIKRLVFEYPTVIKKYNIDYAHFQYISPLRKKCKEIVTIHDLLFLDYPQFFPTSYRLKNKFFFNRSAKRADILLTVSNFSKNEISKHFGIDNSRIFVTPNSILPTNDIEDVNLKGLYGLDKYILTVSRIEPRKNHLNLLKAFVELDLASRGYKLVMVGAKDLSYNTFFDYYNKLNKQCKEHILFLQVPFNELVSLYRQASLFVFSSYCEGFGIPPIEAISYGSPLLCSNSTAMAEFELPDKIVFDPADLEELKLKMYEQLKSPMNKASYASFVLSKYNWEQIALDFYNLLKRESALK